MQTILSDKLEFSRSIDGIYEPVKLPHSLNLNHGFYRLVFSYSQSYKDKHLFLEIKDLSGDYTLYLNNKLINNKSEITKILKKRENILLIELKNDYGISFKGDVILQIRESVYIDNIKIKQSYDDGFNINCFSTIKGDLLGDETIDVELYDEKELVYKTTFSALLKEYSFNVGEKTCWQRDNPYLYKLIFKLNKDEYIINIGFRHLEYQDDKLCLNGQNIKLLSGSYDWKYPYIGKNLTPALFEYDLKLFIQAGINALYVKEYNEKLFKLCDINGIYLIVDKEVINENYHSSIILIQEDDKYQSFDTELNIDADYISNKPNLYTYLRYKEADNGLFIIDEIIGTDGLFDNVRIPKSKIFTSSLAFFNLGNKLAFVGNYDLLKLKYQEISFEYPFKDNLLLISDIRYQIMKAHENLSDEAFVDIAKVFKAFDNKKLNILDKLLIYKLKFINRLNLDYIEELYKKYCGMYINKNDFSYEFIKNDEIIYSPSKAIKLKISLSSNDLSLYNDLALIQVEALDENGNIDRSYNDILKIMSSGKTTIIGSDILALENGYCSFLVKAFKPGNGNVEVVADKLKQNCKIELKIKK